MPEKSNDAGGGGTRYRLQIKESHIAILTSMMGSIKRLKLGDYAGFFRPHIPIIDAELFNYEISAILLKHDITFETNIVDSAIYPPESLLGRIHIRNPICDHVSVGWMSQMAHSYSMIGSAQYDCALEPYGYYLGFQYGRNVRSAIRDWAGDYIDNIESTKPMIDERYLIAMDMHRVMRHALWLSDANRSHGVVDSRRPTQHATEDLMRCEMVNERTGCST